RAGHARPLARRGARVHGGARGDAPEDSRAARDPPGASPQRDGEGAEGPAPPAAPPLSGHDSHLVGRRGSGAEEHTVPVRTVRARGSPSGGCAVAIRSSRPCTARVTLTRARSEAA